MDLLDRLLEHDRWATEQLLAVCRSLSDEQLDRPFDIGHQTLRATFDHLIFNIAAWTAIMHEQPPTEANRARSLAALAERHARAYAEFAAFARRIRDEGRLDQTFTDHFGERMSYASAILHVVLHDAEHRTEVLHMLERLGVPNLPEVDHGLWDHVSRRT